MTRDAFITFSHLFGRQRNEGKGADMLCAELEELEAQFDDIITALENPNLTERDRLALEKARDEISRTITDHQTFGHSGGRCFEE
jgi:hypothetical protein